MMKGEWKAQNAEIEIIKKYLPEKYHNYLDTNIVRTSSSLLLEGPHSQREVHATDFQAFAKTGRLILPKGVSILSSWNTNNDCIFITYLINNKLDSTQKIVMFESIERFYLETWKCDVVVSIWIYLD